MAAKAAESYRAAIAADPSFAQAHASLAWALLDQADLSDPSAEGIAAVDRLVMPHVERAVEIDADTADAYVVKGILLRNTMRPGGGEAYRRAVELDPGNVTATASLAVYELSMGRVDEHFRLARRARELDPLNLYAHLRWLVGAATLGRSDDVRDGIARLRDAFPGHSGAESLACHMLRISGEYGDALVCALELLAKRPGDRELGLVQAGIAGEVLESVGDDARAVAYYERAATAGHGDSQLALLRLRRDPRAMQQLVRDLQGRTLGPGDWGLGEALARGGWADESLAVYRRCRLDEAIHAETNDLPWALQGLAQSMALARRKGVPVDESQLQLLLEHTQTAIDRGARGWLFHKMHAQALMLAGRRDEALEQLRLAIEAPGGPFPVGELTDDPVFQDLQDDAQFKAHIVRLRQRQSESREQVQATLRREGIDWPPS
jgi:tetratricopeptide (TPR) repeat protein